MSTEQTTGETKATRDVKTVSMSDNRGATEPIQARKSHRDSNDRGSLRSNACEAPKKPRGIISTSLVCGLGRPPAEAVLRPGRARTALQAFWKYAIADVTVYPGKSCRLGLLEHGPLCMW